MNKDIEFFDAALERTNSADGGGVYRIENETGVGLITQYSVMPGIEFFHNDIRLLDGQNQNKLPRPGTIEINHCREGRFECEFQNGDCLYLGAGDLSMHRLTYETRKTSFPLGYYHGISITIELERAYETIKRLEAVMGGLDIDLYAVADALCREDSCYIVRGKSRAAHIFSELYDVPPDMAAHYLKAKVLELLMYLNDMGASEHIREKRYFTKTQVKAVKDLEAFMTARLDTHYTIKELAALSGLSVTTLKECFRGIYGSSIYAYMKSYRMQAAAVMLGDEEQSITAVAMAMGYDNPSKFSEVFKKETGALPSEYRKKLAKRMD